MTDQTASGADRSDEQLLARTADGDREAFALLFARHHATVYRFVRQMGGRPDVADDVTQEVFLALLGGPTRFDPRLGALSTYLYGIARNLVRRRLKWAGMRPEVDIAGVDDGTERRLVHQTDPAGEFEQRRSLTVLRHAVSDLPFRFREVVVLCDLHELSYQDAAVVVGCPIGTIRSRLNRARRILIERCRTKLAGHGPQSESLPHRRGAVGADAV